MNTETKILVVDDEPFNLTLMQEFLEELYECLEYAVDGIECLEKIKDNKPDIVLLDVSMPRMDGYQVCEKIKSDPALEDIVVIFVSARGTAEERMKGFDAGGDDYIIKPFKEEEILKKIKTLIQFRSEKQSLQEQLQTMQNVAFDVMAGNAEIGYVIQYLTTLFNSSTIEQIIQATLELAQTLELNICLQINSQGEPIYGAQTGNISPLEKEIMELLSSEGRIYRFKQRCQFNFPQIIVLVKNMPVEDETKYGRIIDVLPTAMEGANSCLNALKLKRHESENISMSKAMDEIETIQKNVTNHIDTVSQMNNQALETLYRTLEHNLPFMGLEEDQEEIITQAIDKVAGTVKESISSLKIINTDINKIKTLVAR